ncbi:MAG: cystathionine gamma-synthase family protein [bacterium]|nr:cystathionine gamma-synthase family protein [bacterium]
MNTRKSRNGFTTEVVHAHRRNSTEHGELHYPITTSAAYGYGKVQDLIDVFQGKKPGDVYARQSTPTVRALEEMITHMEWGTGTVAFATGMAAIDAVLFALLCSGDHIVSSKFLFGNTDSLLKTFQRFGVSVSFVDVTDLANVMDAVTPNTRMVFTETIANPVTQVADLVEIGELCRAHGLVYIVDNTMTSPYLFLPKCVGAHLIVNSLTKYINGHGNALGGAVTDTGLYDWSQYSNIDQRYKKGDASRWGMLQIRKLGLRDKGASLSPDAANRIAIGAETLELRMVRICANALKLAQYLEGHPNVGRVYYPGLESHPQHKRAKSLFRGSSGLMSFELKHGIDHLEFLNRLQISVMGSNLGDTRTMVIPVADTIFHEMGPERRASMGIADSLIRVSTGIEDAEDLIADFEQALSG